MVVQWNFKSDLHDNEKGKRRKISAGRFLQEKGFLYRESLSMITGFSFLYILSICKSFDNLNSLFFPALRLLSRRKF